MTDTEMIETARRLNVSVPMVDMRPIPKAVRVSALRTQAAAFADWLDAHGLRNIRVDPASNVWIGPAQYTVEQLRTALFADGTKGLLRLVRTHPSARGAHARSLQRWYAACAADAFRTEDEDATLRTVGAPLTAMGMELGTAPVPREGE